MPGLPAIEDCTAHGTSINITLIFSLDRYKAVVEAYLRGLERLVATAAIRRGSSPSRRSSSHASTPRPTSGWRPSATRSFGQARDREREARLPALPRGVLGPALGVPRGQGRDEAALPVGLDLDQEPGLPRRHLCRGADRAGDREHDAARDDRGVPGSRRGARRHGARRASTKRRRCSASSRDVGVDYDDVSRRSRRRACRSSPTPSTRSSTSIRAKRGALAAA